MSLLANRSGRIGLVLLVVGLTLWHAKPAEAAPVSSFNFDMESGTLAYENWWSCGSGTATWDTTTTRDGGTRSAKITGCNNGAQQGGLGRINGTTDTMTLTVGQQYTLQGYVKRATGSLLPGNKSLCINGRNGWPNTLCVGMPTDDDQWHFVTVTFTAGGTNPEGTNYSPLMFGSASGATWYDDVWFGPTGSIPTTTTTTTTTTLPPTTTTTPPDAEREGYEDFNASPFAISSVPDKNVPLWDQVNGFIYGSSGGVSVNGWAGGMWFAFDPYSTSTTMDIAGSGFGTGGGCEVYVGTDPANMTFAGKASGTWANMAFATTPGSVNYVHVAYDGPADAGTICAVDNLGRYVTEGDPEGTTWTGSGANPAGNLGGPTTTGEDGLDDCAPSGWSLVNPFAYIGGLGCALKWAFLPSGDSFSVDDLRDAAEDRVPFSWLDSMVDVGPAFADHVRNPNYGQDGGSTCGITMGYQDGLSESFGIDTPNDFDHDAFPTTPSGETGCFGGSDSPTSPLVNQWAPRVKAAFKLMIWIVLGSRLLMMAPWSKGRDGGEPA